MNLINANNPEAAAVYVGKCKNNSFPKHVNAEGVTRRKVKIIETVDDKKVTHNAVLIDSPKTAQYTYIQLGERCLWVKNKTIMDVDKFEVVKTVRKKEAAPAEPAQES